jgi:predicted Zn-dependent protease
VEQALFAFKRAIEAAPYHPQLVLDGLTFMCDTQHWKDAAELARRIQNAKTDSPMLKLLIARALIHAGDKPAGGRALAEAKELVRRSPILEKQFEKEFSDLERNRQ